MYGPMTIFLEADSDFYPSPGTDRGGHKWFSSAITTISPARTPQAADIGSSRTVGARVDTIPSAAPGMTPSPTPRSLPMKTGRGSLFGRIYNRDVSGTDRPGRTLPARWPRSPGKAARPSGPGGNNWSGTDMYGNSLPSYAWEQQRNLRHVRRLGSGDIIIHRQVDAHG